MVRGRAAFAVALALLLSAATARAGAGFGELCETRHELAHGFYWSDTLEDLVGPSGSIDEVSEVAWDDRYVFAKTPDGPWYIIDTSGAGDRVVESFPAESPAWTQRLAELGRGEPSWRYPSSLPKQSYFGCTIRAVGLLLLAVLFVAAVDHPLMVAAAVLGLALLVAHFVRRRARRRRALARG